MSNEFVGFAKSPKAAQGSQKISKDYVFESNEDLSRSLQILLTKGGLDSWLGVVSKFDERIGGKISFALGEKTFGASYTLITIPKRVVLIAEAFGELDFKLKNTKAGSSLSLRLTALLLPEEIAQWEQLAAGLSEKLRLSLNV